MSMSALTFQTAIKMESSTRKAAGLGRRKFIALSTISACAPLFSPLIKAENLSDGFAQELYSQELYFSAATDKNGTHYFVCLNQLGQIVSQIAVDQRGHDAIRSPSGRTAVMISRRPGTVLSSFDLLENRLSHQVHSAEGRHFYGHMLFSADGKYLFVPENDYANTRGLISVRDASTFEVLNEFSSAGLGPHQLGWLSDQKALVVANGGIITHPSRHREKLNIETMRPNLAYLDSERGDVIDVQELEDPKLSIRHFDVSDKNEVLVGMQYQGDKDNRVPLMAIHRPSQKMEALTNIADEELRSLNHYVASVAIDSNSRIGLGTCPRGGKITMWDIDSGDFIASRRVRDVAGVTLDAERSEFVVSNGRGEIFRYNTSDFRLNAQASLRISSLRWDNHLQLS